MRICFIISLLLGSTTTPSEIDESQHRTKQSRQSHVGWIVFLLIAVTGLLYVKWFPHYNRAFVAAATHSIGSSILMGTATNPPAPSWDAALNYALAYGNAIWQAMVLGLLLDGATNNTGLLIVGSAQKSNALRRVHAGRAG